MKIIGRTESNTIMVALSFAIPFMIELASSDG